MCVQVAQPRPVVSFASPLQFSVARSVVVDGTTIIHLQASSIALKRIVRATSICRLLNRLNLKIIVFVEEVVHVSLLVTTGFLRCLNAVLVLPSRLFWLSFLLGCAGLVLILPSIFDIVIGWVVLRALPVELAAELEHLGAFGIKHFIAFSASHPQRRAVPLNPFRIDIVDHPGPLVLSLGVGVQVLTAIAARYQVLIVSIPLSIFTPDRLICVRHRHSGWVVPPIVVVEEDAAAA